MSSRKFSYFILLLAVAAILIDACRSSENKTKPSKKAETTQPTEKLGALPALYKSPADNPSTPEKIELGRLLFYDPVLSGAKDIACATCHHPEFGYSENIELSIGTNAEGLGENRRFNTPNDIPFVKRNSQTLLNSAFNGIDMEGNYSPENAPMFWDVRASSLEQQAMMPVKTFEEMRGHGFTEDMIVKEIVTRINKIKKYRDLFANVFAQPDAVSETNISKALAAFQRSLIANNSRFDKYMRGDQSALSGREIEGMEIFINTGCVRCHNGPMLSDYKTHILGIADNEKLSVSDSGYNKTYAFRTPSLRNLRFTSPYMHSGKIATLENVFFFYEDLHDKKLPNKNVNKVQLDTLAQMLNVQFKDANQVIEFLNTLNDGSYDKKIPSSVPSGLPVGGRIK